MTTVTVSQVEWAIDTLNMNKDVLFTVLDNTSDVNNAANIIKAMGTVSNGTYFIDIVTALNMVITAREVIATDTVVQCIERDITCGDTFYGTELYVVDVMAGTTKHTTVNGKVTVSAIKPEECKAALVWYNGLCAILN